MAKKKRGSRGKNWGKQNRVARKKARDTKKRIVEESKNAAVATIIQKRQEKKINVELSLKNNLMGLMREERILRDEIIHPGTKHRKLPSLLFKSLVLQKQISRTSDQLNHFSTKTTESEKLLKRTKVNRESPIYHVKKMSKARSFNFSRLSKKTAGFYDDEQFFNDKTTCSDMDPDYDPLDDSADDEGEKFKVNKTRIKKTTEGRGRRTNINVASVSMDSLEMNYDTLPNYISSAARQTWISSDLQKVDKGSFWTYSLIAVDWPIVIWKLFADRSIEHILDKGFQSMVKKVVTNQHLVCKCTCLKRSKYGQIYIANGLGYKSHFTLIKKSRDIFQSIVDGCGISFVTCDNAEDWINLKNDDTLVFASFIPRLPSSSNNCEAVVMRMLKEVALLVLPILLKTVHEGNKRTSMISNMGLTDQKCHDYKSFSIFRNLIPDLINVPKGFDEKILEKLGRLLSFVSNEYLRSIDRYDLIQRDEHSIDAIKPFREQLGIKENIATFPGITILGHSTNVGLHTDMQNPKRSDSVLDNTLQVSTSISTHGFDADLLTPMFHKGVRPHELSFSILFYNRGTLVRYSSSKENIDSYQSKNISQVEGRTKLVENFTDMGCDYNSSCFTPKGHQALSLQCKILKTPMHFMGKGVGVSERCDKLSFYSCIIHMYMVYASINGVSQRETLELGLFFAHQCNATSTICEAMIRLTGSPVELRRCRYSGTTTGRSTLYHALAKMCKDIRSSAKDVDVGCAANPRFSPTNNSLFSEHEVNKYCNGLGVLCESARDSMISLKSSQTTINGKRERISIVSSLLDQFSNINGIANVRGGMMLAIFSITHILPLSFYIYLPLHFYGGPGVFLQENMCLKKRSGADLETLNSEILDELCGTFNQNVTSAIIEQTMCASARSRLRLDFYYFLPRYVDGNIATCGRYHIDGKIQHRNKQLQCFFLINGYGNCNWTLEMFDGSKKHIVFCDNAYKPNCVLSWDRRNKFLKYNV